MSFRPLSLLGLLRAVVLAAALLATSCAANPTTTPTPEAAARTQALAQQPPTENSGPTDSGREDRAETGAETGADQRTDDSDETGAETGADQRTDDSDETGAGTGADQRTDDSDETSADEGPPADPGTAEQGAPAALGVASDRVVVTSSSGQLYLMDPSGQNRLELTGEGDAPAIHPVWRPDGRRLAWSQGNSIISTNPDGTERRDAGAPFSGYFGYWDPTSTTLGFLGNAAPGTGLILDEGGGADEPVIDSDSFYFFSWSPDGTRWIVHAGSGLKIVGIDGSQETLDLDAGRFRAPIWADDGSIILAVRGRGGPRPSNDIVRVDPATRDTETLLTVGEFTNFVLDPTGRFLAIESVDVFEAPPTSEVESVSYSASRAIRAQGDRPVRVAEVLVHDLLTGETVQVVERVSGGFWWSPDGSRLAVLVADRADTTKARWLVWSREGQFETDRFQLTPLYGSAYVPFFDQFAQSVTPWSPDSSRFVYTGTDEQGRPGVFVQDAVAGIPAVRVAEDGIVAFWSPT